MDTLILNTYVRPWCAYLHFSADARFFIVLAFDSVILNITLEVTALRRAVLRDVLTLRRIAVCPSLLFNCIYIDVYFRSWPAAKSILSYFRSAKQRCIVSAMNLYRNHESYRGCFVCCI